MNAKYEQTQLPILGDCDSFLGMTMHRQDTTLIFIQTHENLSPQCIYMEELLILLSEGRLSVWALICQL